MCTSLERLYPAFILLRSSHLINGIPYIKASFTTHWSLKGNLLSLIHETAEWQHALAQSTQVEREKKDGCSLILIQLLHTTKREMTRMIALPHSSVGWREGLVMELAHKWFMECLETGDDGWDLILLWQDCASEMPCSRDLFPNETEKN